MNSSDILVFETRLKQKEDLVDESQRELDDFTIISNKVI